MYKIINFITEQDLPKFQKKVDEYCKDKTITQKIIGATSIPMSTQQGMGIINVPFAYIEHECTKEEWQIWSENRIIKLNHD